MRPPRRRARPPPPGPPAPVVRRILQRTGALLGVIPDTGRDIDLAGMRELVQGAAGD